MFSEEIIKKKLEIVQKSNQLLEDLTWKERQLSMAENLLKNEGVKFVIKCVTDYNNFSFEAGDNKDTLKYAVAAMKKERDAILEEINKLILIAQ